MRSLDPHAASIVEAVRQPLVVLDGDLRCDLFGATTQIESRPGIGTTCTVMLPS